MEGTVIIWVGAVLLFALAEILTVGLISIWFVIGAAAALIAAILHAALWVQLALFLGVSVLLLLLTKPLLKQHFDSKITPTNADMVIGKEAIVTENINNLKASGAVTVSGKVWVARGLEEESIAVGTVVEIVRIEGIKLIVKQKAQKN